MRDDRRVESYQGRGCVDDRSVFVVWGGFGVVVVPVNHCPREVRPVTSMLGLMVAMMIQSQVETDAEGPHTRGHPEGQDQPRKQTSGLRTHGADCPRPG